MMYPRFSSAWILVFVLFFTFAACENEFYEDDFAPIETPDNGGDDDFGDDDFDDDDDDDNDGSGAGNNGEISVELSGDGGIAVYRAFDRQLSLVEKEDRGDAWMQDPRKHEEMWDFVTDMIPNERLRHLYAFEVFDGDNGLAGYVYNLTDNLQDWMFALDIRQAYPDESTMSKDGEFVHTLIHEYGHILSLNDEQLDPNAGNCQNYDTGEGCAFETSYIDEFYERFWEDIADEHAGTEGDPDANYDFYLKYQDRFWSDYSATNPAEDFAEVLTYFVALDQEPTGNSIKDRKIQMLYEYPELRDLRDRMRGASTLTMPASGRFAAPKCRHAQHKRRA